ncbi:MAG: dipeptide epimerase [Gemmatimonadaceae bacterium]|nr:dipeptide epimerase [Gemmatimonadaceae bacterium]
MRLETEVVTVHTTHPFVIARGGSSEWRVVWVRLVDADGLEGWGEAAPSRFYGETADTVLAALDRLRPIIESADPSDIEATEVAMVSALRFNAAARCAVSAALHDLQGKRLGVPLWKLWGLSPAASPRTSFTIAIAADDDTLRARVHEALAAGYPILKVKLGSDRDRRIIQLVRDEAPAAILRVDANAAWTPKHTLAMAPLLRDLCVEFIEQPLPPHDLEGLRFVRDHCDLPIVADESCLVATDVAKLAGVVDGVNLKLAKCGSLREAIRIIHTARAHGMLVMAGCMIETSLGITAAAHLAPLLDCVDLDGAALLKDDPFRGATITNGIVTLPTAPGLGVTRR